VALTQRDKVLKALRAAGGQGVTSLQLAQHCGLRYGARVMELRDQGFEIETVRVNRSVYVYKLTSEPAPASPIPSGPGAGCDVEDVSAERGVTRPAADRQPHRSPAAPRSAETLFDVPGETTTSAVTGRAIREAA
jgi:hypothetical protein